MDLVLVHGGGCGSWCWEPLLPLLHSPVFAVDLPPREIRGRSAVGVPPAGLFDLTVGDWADALLADLDTQGIDRAVLVGHSLGGLTIAEVARRAPERVAHLVFVSAAVPPEGGAVVDTLPPELQAMTRDALAEVVRARAVLPGIGAAMPEESARQLFCNDLDDAATAQFLASFGAEVVGVVGETVSRAGIPPELPKTYVRLLRDQALPPDNQDQLIANLSDSPGGPVEVVELDASHMVMLGRPDLLAPVLERIAAASN